MVEAEAGFMVEAGSGAFTGALGRSMAEGAVSTAGAHFTEALIRATAADIILADTTEAGLKAGMAGTAGTAAMVGTATAGMEDITGTDIGATPIGDLDLAGRIGALAGAILITAIIRGATLPTARIIRTPAHPGIPVMT